ncbi:hypothetical protein KGM_201550 [Danaus plexippus plexippus]|uniref:Uncharacterized protein n=1 Tax=Danaus plexippus plexippus TaxID=278856 RepID=A0A212F3R7_DANPL|nr:hypothetical protein KGM_201550 [Danaus plexippus plexippus]
MFTFSVDVTGEGEVEVGLNEYRRRTVRALNTVGSRPIYTCERYGAVRVSSWTKSVTETFFFTLSPYEINMNPTEDTPYLV